MEVDQVDQAIDEALYSRQLYVLGHEAMKRMASSSVLIVGMKGLGIEIAKNVILAGVHSLAIWDDRKVELSDLSTQFFLKEDDIGKPRATACRDRLAELNTYVPVSVLDNLNEESISKFHVVVLTDSTLDEKIQIGQFCHQKSISFIVAEIKGVFGSIFCDFGANFVVTDVNGENPVSALVASITQEGESVVTTLDETRHGLEDGDYVTFAEVQGMVELNGCEARKVKVLGPYTFSIGDTSSLTPYKSGGLVIQVKQPKTLNFTSFPESLAKPGEFLISDFAKFDRPDQLHIGFQALDAFKKKNGFDPRPRNEDDAIEVLKLAEEIKVKLGRDVTLDEKVIKQMSYGARGDISPMCAVIGGISSQEVLKACSGKFHPIFQWFYFDALETVPEDLTAEDCAPIQSRYDPQIAVFGKSIQHKIENLKQFLVGSGAIGCEMLKNWSLMGLGTGSEGRIFVTDMDTIEKSNLNRQFLFRNSDVGKLKSQCAAAAVTKMNPALENKITIFQDRVGPDTEQVFNDSFFDALDVVTNALDNVDARKYVDRRCVYYRKPLFESGTLGTKGNTQVVLPDITESYSSSQDPPEKSIPICTLKNFPNALEHCIQWARDLFEGLFKNPSENVNAYLNNPKQFLDEVSKQNGKKEIFDTLKEYLVTSKAIHFEDCIIWARMQFEYLFNNTIQQLLFNFPSDSTTSTGVPFWSGAKRCPTALKFDLQDPLHLSFVKTAAILHAENYGIKGTTDTNLFIEVIQKMIIPDFQPKKGVKIQVNENENTANAEAPDDDEIDKIVSSLPTENVGYRLNAVEFEKDDDTNHHIDFITACANLRASNYKIENGDRHKIKGIAGKIIPAIATTTSLVTGLVCLELYKYIAGKRKIEDFKNGFVNLALPLFAFSEPIAAPKRKYDDKEWTLWDRFDVQGPKTLEELLNYFKNEHNLEITMLSCGVSMLYGFFIDKKKLAERMPMKMHDLIETISKKPLPEYVKAVVLEICCNDSDGEDVEVPFVRYYFNK